MFEAPLSLTSQFGFCGLPLRLDSYAGCGFQCTFCFARFRGGNSHGAAIRPADGNALRGILDRAFNNTESSLGVLAQFLRRRVPIHFGGMSDPFQPAELRFKVTESFFRALARFRYPTVVSTRSILVATEPYLSLLREIGNVVVQFSFSSSRDVTSARFEPHSPHPSDLLRTMSTLTRRGINVTCRWQPFIPGFSEKPEEFVGRVSTTGCRHVALEHLKIPLERQHPLWESFTHVARRDFHEEYKNKGAVRDGREFILPANVKINTVLEAARAVRNAGMTFGAADNEFQYLSDTECCCSGVDQFPGFENWFKHQIGNAVRKQIGRAITYEGISHEWSPTGSIDRYLNSRSRLSRRSDVIGSVLDHMRARWNDVKAPGNPSSFYGIIPSEECSPSGHRIYGWSISGLAHVKRAISSEDPPQPQQRQSELACGSK
jgi:DNA repair photolyase